MYIVHMCMLHNMSIAKHITASQCAAKCVFCLLEHGRSVRSVSLPASTQQIQLVFLALCCARPLAEWSILALWQERIDRALHLGADGFYGLLGVDDPKLVGFDHILELR